VSSCRDRSQRAVPVDGMCRRLAFPDGAANDRHLDHGAGAEGNGSRIMTRKPLSDLDGRRFDVVVIGGGINGAAAAQKAAAAGYSVLIVDKSDFATGATGRSGRLLHCGLRYFETENPVRYFMTHPGRFFEALRMARHGMRARHDLVSTTPSRTRPMTVLFPIFRGGPYKGWQADLAFRLFKSLAPGDVPLDYRRLAPDEALRNPLVAALANKETIRSVASYTEYQIDWPERLCVDSILDAERMGAVARNYTAASLGEIRDSGRAVNLTDMDDSGSSATVYGDVVFCMSGIWIDEVLRTARPDMPQKSFGTKGASMVVRLPESCRDFGVATINSQHEPFYCIPWYRYHLIGPTETPFQGDLDSVFADADDMAFLLHEARAILPGLNIEASSVVYSWAGIRPLTFDPAMPKGKRSRELHDLGGDGLENVFAMTAGPVMTYRSAGDEVVTKLQRILPPSREPTDHSYSPPPLAEGSNTALLSDTDPSIRLGDVRRAVTAEHARTLMDVLYRRVGLGWRHEFTQAELEAASQAMAPDLGWSEDHRRQAIETFRAEATRLFGARTS